MVASVPVDTMRMRSNRRVPSIVVRSRTSSASSVSAGVEAPNDRPRAAASCTAFTTLGCACPSSAGPQEQTRSTYSRPSTSVTNGPRAPTRKRGVPPTERNARTGEFTPPG